MTLHTLDLRDGTVGDDLRTRLCWLYYDTIYRGAFPIADEAEDPTVWLPLLSEVPPRPSPIVHLVLGIADTRPAAEVDAGSLLGGIIFEYFRASRAALATYLCIRPDQRSRGIGAALVARAVDILGSDAAGAAVPLFAEAEDPGQQTDPAVREIARARLPILRRLGFRKLPINYRQPALGPGKKPLDNLSFLMFTGGEPGAIGRHALHDFMVEFYAGLNAGMPDEARMFSGLSAATVTTVDLQEGT